MQTLSNRLHHVQTASWVKVSMVAGTALPQLDASRISKQEKEPSWVIINDQNAGEPTTVTGHR